MTILFFNVQYDEISASHGQGGDEIDDVWCGYQCLFLTPVSVFLCIVCTCVYKHNVCVCVCPLACVVWVHMSVL